MIGADSYKRLNSLMPLQAELNKVRLQLAEATYLHQEQKNAVILIRSCIDDMSRGVKPKEAYLERLGLKNVPTPFLLFKLKSLLDHHEKLEAESRLKVHRLQELLNQLERCPYCHGSGRLRKGRYEILDGGIMSPSYSVQYPVCGGTGRITEIETATSKSGQPKNC